MSTHRFTRRTFLAGTTLAGLATVAARTLLAAPPAWAAAVAKVGDGAPGFTLAATTGKSVSLADQRGKLVILEWTNHDCPYVRKHYETGNMQALQKETTAQGVIWLTLISSSPGTQGYVTPKQADELTATRKASPTSVLLDPTGIVGKAYGATNTPHMYLIDNNGLLVYAGAIDDRPTTRRADVQGARNYVRAALEDVAAGRAVRTGLDLEPAPRLSWPLEVGKWGTTRLLWRSALPQPLPNFTGSVGLIWQVDAHEDVATPAGTFPAFRITQKIETVTGSQGGSGQQFGQVMLWYAPDVQRFVKAQGNLKGLNWELNRAATPTPPPVVATPAPQPAEPRPPAEPPRREPAPTPAPRAEPPKSGDTEAPKIAINQPPPDARLTDEKILVTGLVTDNVEVVRVQVLVNGVEAPSLLDVGVVGRGVPLGVLAELKPGPNVIEVVATDKAGNVAQVTRNVTRVTGPSAAIPAPVAGAGPRIATRWAVVIGVGDYE